MRAKLYTEIVFITILPVLFYSIAIAMYSVRDRQVSKNIKFKKRAYARGPYRYNWPLKVSSFYHWNNLN